MKCPACKATHRRKDGPTCSKCGRKFVFFERRDITDQRFTVLIDKASAGGTQYFTINQLRTLWAQKTVQSAGVARMVVGVLLILVAGFQALRGLTTLVEAATALAGVGLVVWGVVRRRNPKPPPPENLWGWADTWMRAGHAIPTLLTTPSLYVAPPEAREPDVFDYGVERILIVQHDLLVDLFVRNGLHTKERALVISEHGYPRYLLEPARKLLERSPELPVFLLHDADGAGLMMHSRLERNGLFPLAGHPLIDTGLTPREVGRIRKLRALAPGRCGNALPADALPYGLMAGGFALAFTERLPLSVLVERKDPDQGASFG